MEWDEQVSRLHAVLECFAGKWTVVDDGLSRNGTFVNGQRIIGRRRLFDRDVVMVGRTLITFRTTQDEGSVTPIASGVAQASGLSRAQRRVLVTLCRIATAQSGVVVVPSNAEISADLGVSVEAVRTHLKALFRLFEISDLPPNRKRSELVRRALAAGVVSPSKG